MTRKDHQTNVNKDCKNEIVRFTRHTDRILMRFLTSTVFCFNIQKQNAPNALRLRLYICFNYSPSNYSAATLVPKNTISFFSF
jgi:hypothetical protein